MPTPDSRILPRNDAEVREDGDYVLYWMIAARRTTWSFGLQRAREEADRLGVPLLVFEPLRVGYRWASDRHHRFVIEGMADNAARLDEAGVTYLPYVEPTEGAGKGLLKALADRAALVVTDHFPTFFLPRMVAAAGEALDVRLEAVDGNGVMPLSLAPKVFTVAHSFRRHVQKTVHPHLEAFPEADPLEGYDGGAATVPEAVAQDWPAADLDALLADGGLDDLPIDHDVPPVAYRGGPEAAAEQLAVFLDERLADYPDRNHPDEDVASGLSPWLHYGHLGAHEVIDAVFARDDFDPGTLGKATGKREGWWGLSPEVEAFLDEILTWREVGYTFCHLVEDHEELESLPEWAQTTLAEHAGDERPYAYDYETFRDAQTHDEIWNAAQRQLRTEGRIHNYLRMLWGKKILHWTPDPETALDIMIDLNNRYAVDGRDPNSVSGIFWVLGRFDRAWGPEREVFGKVRYMTSKSTKRKLRLSAYLERWGDDAAAG